MKETLFLKIWPSSFIIFSSGLKIKKMRVDVVSNQHHQVELTVTFEAGFLQCTEVEFVIFSSAEFSTYYSHLSIKEADLLSQGLLKLLWSTQIIDLYTTLSHLASTISLLYTLYAVPCTKKDLKFAPVVELVKLNFTYIAVLK